MRRPETRDLLLLCPDYQLGGFPQNQVRTRCLRDQLLALRTTGHADRLLYPGMFPLPTQEECLEHSEEPTPVILIRFRTNLHPR